MADGPPSPDSSAPGILGRDPPALRYGDTAASSPYEVPGIIRSWMADRVRVLDVGCGAGGQTAESNAGKDNDVVCVEPDPLRSSAAREKGLNVYTGFFDDQFADSCGTFDRIIFTDVLEHVVDPGSMLTRARRCLNPGGSVILSVPNVAHWTVRMSLLIGRFDYADGGIMDATHVRWFTRRTLLAVIRNAGFEVERTAVSAGLWMPEYHAGALRLIPRRLLARCVLILLRWFPRLIGCQYVVQSRIARDA